VVTRGIRRCFLVAGLEGREGGKGGLTGP
jgi:hypothetical protein